METPKLKTFQEFGGTMQEYIEYLKKEAKGTWEAKQAKK